MFVEKDFQIFTSTVGTRPPLYTVARFCLLVEYS